MPKLSLLGIKKKQLSLPLSPPHRSKNHCSYIREPAQVMTQRVRIVGDSLVAREGIFAQSGEHPSVMFQGGRIFERGGGKE